MECSEPGAIRPEELIAHLAGEHVRPAVVEHLAHCGECSSQLATYRRIELKLINKLYRWDCPSNRILGEYQLGLLTTAQASEVKSHLHTCLLCASEVATLTEFLADDPMLSERTALPQEHVAMPGIAAYNHRPVQDVRRVLEQAREGVRRIVASLLPPQPRVAFQRDADAQAAQWPRRYAAEDISISLQIERGPHSRGALQLLGFVTRKDMAVEALQGTPVQLSAQSQTVYTQNVDDLGNFVFPSLVPATYALELQLPEGIVVIEHIPVTAQEE